MSMSRIDYDSVRSGINQCLHTFQGIGCHTYTRSYAKAALAILASHRFIFSLGDVFISNQAYQFIIFIDYRQFFYLIFLQNLSGSFQVCRLIGGNDILFRHYLIDTLATVFLETKVAIGNNSYQISFIIHYRNTTDFILGHQIQSIRNRRTSLDSHRIINHTVFGTFYDSNLTSLLFNRHILMNHTNTAFTSNGNSHFRFGNSIHSGCYKRDF